MVFKGKFQRQFTILILLIFTGLIFAFLYSRRPVTESSDGFIRYKSAKFLRSNISSVKIIESNNFVTENMTESPQHTTDCKPRDVKLSPTPLPVTGLVSFPGSGNTWTRHLIQQMTGIGTSSVYCDGGLRSKGFPFECHREKQKTVVVKTHESAHFPQFKKIVLLIRNPFDALLAYANFAKAGHTGHPSDKVLKEAAVKMFNGSLRWYINLTNRTIERFKGPVYVLQYEKLKTDMGSELAKLATFLAVPVTQRDIECTVKLQEGNFHRKTDDVKHLRLLREAYSQDKLDKMREAARITERLLKNAYNVDIKAGGEIETELFPSQGS